jgi:hypothetical protein
MHYFILNDREFKQTSELSIHYLVPPAVKKMKGKCWSKSSPEVVVVVVVGFFVLLNSCILESIFLGLSYGSCQITVI